MVATDAPAVGALVAGRYAVARRLASGGTADAWLAADTRLDRPVVLKTPRLGRADAADAVRREGALLARLAHPVPPACYDAGSVDGIPYVALEYIDGPDAGDLAAAHGIACIDEGRRAARAWCDALDALHASGIVHGDLKPAHLRLDRAGSGRVIDFGNAGGPPGEPGVVIGSAAYLAPEVRAGAPATEAADRYALGCVLYRLFTGRPPFDDRDPHALAVRHATEAPRSPREHRAALPAPLAGAILALLAKNPAHRPSSAAASFAGYPSGQPRRSASAWPRISSRSWSERKSSSSANSRTQSR